jgi:hypothetical protein
MYVYCKTPDELRAVLGFAGMYVQDVSGMVPNLKNLGGMGFLGTKLSLSALAKMSSEGIGTSTSADASCDEGVVDGDALSFRLHPERIEVNYILHAVKPAQV